MSHHPPVPRDPWLASLTLVTAFTALVLYRLATPSIAYFDEVHYLPAARAMLEGGPFLNREHPVLGKALIAAGIATFGDTAFGWRFPSAIAAAIGLLAAMRAMWLASKRRFATLAFGLLMSTGFALFVQARIAMLDMFMAAFVAIALWQCAAAVREPEQGALRLLAAGAALGLALASKWNAAPLAVLPGLAFLACRVPYAGWHTLTARRGPPVPGVPLWLAAILLGAVPLVVYGTSFMLQDGMKVGDVLAHQFEMARMQRGVIEPHPYQSGWQEWVLNWRAIWYLYEPVDGAQRGVLLIGNPLTMLLGLPALGWCAWIALTKRRGAEIALVVLYTVSLGFWIVADKPVQFYYHYFLPGSFLLGALALALDTLWARGRRWLAVLPLVGSAALFAWFYPILSAAPLSGPGAFAQWMWLDSWR